jgi:hypothetical protein
MPNTVIETIPTIAVQLDQIAFTLSSPGTLTVPVTGLHHVLDEVTLSTTDATLSKGNIVTIGRFYFKNIDPTNTILISDDGVVYALSLKPGEDAKGRWNTAAVHAKASAGTPKLYYLLVED